MSISKRKYCIAGLILISVFAASWFWEIEIKMPRIGLEFEPGNSTITPTFLQVTQGSPLTNYVNSPSGKEPRSVNYGHTLSFYSGTLKPEPYPRYIFKKTFSSPRWPGSLIRPSEQTTYTPKNISMLWLGYTGTNSLMAKDAVLVSTTGDTIPLLPSVGQVIPTRKECMDSFELPTLLTNKGTYRLMLTNSNEEVLSFEIR